MMLHTRAEFLSELETLVSKEMSIFRLKLLDPVETIVRTRIVPVALNIAGQETRFGVSCNEKPYDLYPLDRNLPMGRLQRIRFPTANPTLLAVVIAVRDELVKIQREKIRQNEGMSSVMDDLENIVGTKGVLSYEFLDRSYETDFFIKVSVPTLSYLRSSRAVLGRNCKMDSVILKLVFETMHTNDPVLKKFRVQFSYDVGESGSEVDKKIKDVTYSGIERYIEDMRNKVKDILRERFEKLKSRLQLINSILAVYNTLGVVRGINSVTISEMDLSLGEGKLLKIILRKTYPSSLPDLVLFRSERDEETGEVTVKKTTVRKADVFEGDKDPDNIATHIIHYIQRESLLE